MYISTGCFIYILSAKEFDFQPFAGSDTLYNR